MYKHIRLGFEGETIDEVFDQCVEYSQKRFLEDPLKPIEEDIFTIVREDGEPFSDDEKQEIALIAKITCEVVLERYYDAIDDLQRMVDEEAFSASAFGEDELFEDEEFYDPFDDEDEE